MPARKRPGRDLAVGVLFALGLTLVALGIMAVGGDLPFLSNRVTYRIVFPETGGLLLGAPVRISGVEVGTISAIDLPTDPREGGIEVQISIDSIYRERVREDSRAALRVLQLLTNEKYVEISSGSPELHGLPPGSQIRLAEERGYIERGEAIADSLAEITSALNNILKPLERGEGLLGKAIQDPQFGLAGVEALGRSLENLEAITAQVRDGRGAMGRLLYDEELAADLVRTVDRMGSLMDWIDENRASLDAMFGAEGTARMALEDLAEAAASVRSFSERLETEDSLLGQLVAGDECLQDLSANVCETLRNVASITGKIDSGEGTLGALVNERSLHDATEDMAAGINDSKFARWLTRHYRKKGIVAQEQQAGPAASPDGE